MSVYMGNNFYGIIRDVVWEKVKSACGCCKRKNEQQKQVNSIFERTIQHVKSAASLDEKLAEIRQGVGQLRDIHSENDRIEELVFGNIHALEALSESLPESPHQIVLPPQIVLVNPSPNPEQAEKVKPLVQEAPIPDDNAIPTAPDINENAPVPPSVSSNFSQELRRQASENLRRMAQTRPHLNEASLKALRPNHRIRYGYRQAFLDAALTLRPRDVSENDWKKAIMTSYYDGDAILGTVFGWFDSTDGFQPNLRDFVDATAQNKRYVTSFVYPTKKAMSQRAQSIAERYAKTVSSSCALPPQVSEQDVSKKNLKRTSHSTPLWEEHKEPLQALAHSTIAMPEDALSEVAREVFESFATPSMRSLELGPAPIFEEAEMEEFMTRLTVQGTIARELAQEIRDDMVPDFNLIGQIATRIKDLPAAFQEKAFAAFSRMQQLWLLEQIKDESAFSRLSEQFVGHMMKSYSSPNETHQADAVAFYLKKYSEEKLVGRLYRALGHAIEEKRRQQ